MEGWALHSEMWGADNTKDALLDYICISIPFSQDLYFNCGTMANLELLNDSTTILFMMKFSVKYCYKSENPSVIAIFNFNNPVSYGCRIEELLWDCQIRFSKYS